VQLRRNRFRFGSRDKEVHAMKRSAVVLVVTLMVSSVLGSGGPAVGTVLGSNGRIVFSRDDPNLGDTVSYVVDPDGSDLHVLLGVPSPGTSESPRWSPDGSRIAVLSGPCCPATNAAVIVDPDTGSARVLTAPSPAIETLCWVWSPNARRLACEGHGNDDASLTGLYTIRSSDGRDLTRLTSNPGGDDVPIDYSPDGSRIVFGRTGPAGPPGNNSALFVVDTNGSGLHRITPWGFSDDDGSWSPDGTRIVFEHLGSLYTVHPDGTGLVKLALQTGSSTTAFSAFDAGWSPDGTKLVFSLRARDGAGTVREGIAIANADGSDVRMITTSPTRDASGDWGSDVLAA
jgi:Tol biopolymer transport system component